MNTEDKERKAKRGSKMTLLTRFKQELMISKLYLKHETPNDFQISQISCLNDKPFWIIRLLLAIYFVISFIISLTHYRNITLWVVYLTSVNHIIVTIYVCSCAFITTRHIWRSRVKTNKPITEQETLNGSESKHVELPGRLMNCYFKFHWLIFNLSINVCTMVFFSYWILVFINDTHALRNPRTVYLTIDRHGLNLLILIFEFICSKTPIHLLHFLYPSCFIGLYFISNVIYWSSTKKLIYGEMLNYGKNTGTAVGMVIAAVVVAIPLMHFCWFLLYLLKEYCINKHRETRDYELTNEYFAL